MTRENELLHRIKQGDTSCWEELVSMYYEDILRYCIYHSPDMETAQDAVQETFLKVIRFFPQYRNGESFGDFCTRWRPIPVRICGEREKTWRFRRIWNF